MITKKIDLERDLSFFLESVYKEYDYYHEARTFLMINSLRPVYYTKFNDIYKKLEKMGCLCIPNITDDVHLSKNEVQFLKELENNLEKAENFLEIETPIFIYGNHRPHFVDILPY
ncbi:hypothetical protein [Vibrio phage phiKT1024]|nr:hypothetical protein [Vibrio phage phiKT1024]